MAFLAGLLLMVWARKHDRPDPSVTVTTFERVETQPGRDPLLQGSTHARTDAAEAGSAPEPTTLVVRVVDGVDGEPVQGARVEIRTALPDDAWPEWTRAGTRLAHDATDDAGRVEFRPSPPPEAGTTLVAAVTHPDFAATSRVVDAVGETHVALSRGLPVAGRVVAVGSGRPIAGVPVTLTSADLPPDGAGHVIVLGRPGAEATSVSDADGAFHFTAPPGRYFLRAGDEEWTLKRPRKGDLVAVKGNLLRVDAGETDVRVEMDRYRLVRFELIDAASKRRVTSVPTDVFAHDLGEPIPGHGAGSLLSTVSVFQDGRWRRLGHGDTERCIYTGLALAPSDGSDVPDTTRILLKVPRYRSASCEVRLLTLEEIDAGELDSIPLTREHQGADATLVVRIQAPYAGRYLTRPVPFVYTWDDPGGGYSTHRAVPSGEGWAVHDLPARRLRLVVDDGIQLSEEQTLDLSSGGMQEATVRMLPATGIVVDLRSLSGERVPRVSVWTRSDEGRERRVPDFTRRWSLGERLDAARPFVHRVEPGKYAVTVYAEGGGWWEGDVTVALGEVTTIEGRLREPTQKARR